MISELRIRYNAETNEYEAYREGTSPNRCGSGRTREDAVEDYHAIFDAEDNARATTPRPEGHGDETRN